MNFYCGFLSLPNFKRKISFKPSNLGCSQLPILLRNENMLRKAHYSVFCDNFVRHFMGLGIVIDIEIVFIKTNVENNFLEFTTVQIFVYRFKQFFKISLMNHQ